MGKTFFLKLSFETDEHEPLIFKVPDINDPIWKIFEGYVNKLKEEKAWEDPYVKALSAPNFDLFQDNLFTNKNKKYSELNLEEVEFTGLEVLMAHLVLKDVGIAEEPDPGCDILGVMPEPELEPGPEPLIR